MTTTVVRKRTWARIALPLGFGVIVFGAWGALIPLVGPYFDFGFDTNSHWQLSEQHWTLSIVPGAAAVAAGVLLMLPTRGRIGAWIAAAAGAWFAAGPFVHPLWSDAVAPLATDEGKRAALWIAYFMGPAVLIAYLSGVSQGVRRSTTVVAGPAADITAAAGGRAPAESRPVSVR
jgi:hypothetical protein